MPQTQPQPTLVQKIIADGIKSNPEAAAREVPEILGKYILDNTLLNRVYRAAKNVVDFPSQNTLAALRWAVRDAEGPESRITLWDEREAKR